MKIVARVITLAVAAPLLAFSVGNSVAQADSPAQGSGEDPSLDRSYPGVWGRLNLYEDDNYDGQHESRNEYDSDFGNDDFGDEMSSFVNKTGRWWILYKDAHYIDRKLCIRPRSHDANIGNAESGGWLEDEISSASRRGRNEPTYCDFIMGHPNN